jgi:hypothetical protein
LGHAGAFNSVAPMQLHCLICHMGTNTLQIIAALDMDGGGRVLLQYSQLDAAHRVLPKHLVLGICFWKHRKTTKKLFLKATARLQILLWQKVKFNPNYLVVFISATPNG